MRLYYRRKKCAHGQIVPSFNTCTEDAGDNPNNRPKRPNIKHHYVEPTLLLSIERRGTASLGIALSFRVFEVFRGLEEGSFDNFASPNI